MMGIKEGPCDDPWVFYVGDESVNSTAERKKKKSMRFLAKVCQMLLGSYVKWCLRIGR